MKWIRAAILAAALVVALYAAALAEASSHTIIESTASAEMVALWQQWADESPMPTPIGAVTVVGDDCNGDHAACAYPAERLIYLPDTPYLFDDPVYGEDERDRDMVRYLFFHELGHVEDHGRPGPRAYRHWFDDLAVERGWERSGVSLREPLADAYAFCSIDMQHMPPFAKEVSGFVYGFHPSGLIYRQVCRRFRSEMAW